MAKGDKGKLRLPNVELDTEETDSIRLAIGSRHGARSAIWRLWNNKKGDIYVAVRTLGGILKTSLHRDGRCYTGLTSEYHGESNPDAPNASRHMDRWSLPADPIVCAFQIIIPGSELRCYPSDEAGNMRWFPAPSADEMFIASVFIVDPGVELPTWPGAERGSFPIGLLATPTRRAWIVGHVELVNESVRSSIEEYRQRVAEMSKAAHAVGHRMVLIGHRNDTMVRHAMDLAWQDGV